MEVYERRGLPDLESLSELVDDWQSQPVDDRIDANTIVNSVGVSVGQHIRNRTSLTWAIATDRQGSELALSGSIAEVLIYPQNLVAKRVVSGQKGFLIPLVEAMIKDVNSAGEASTSSS